VTAAADTAAFAIDGMMPARRLRAESERDVVEAIRAANAGREAVVLWGGGTRISIGDPPRRYDTALELSGLRGVVEHEPGDLTITVRAGTTMAELDALLAPHGQWWPVEVAHPHRATVGGTLASAAGGPSRYRYFHVRDWTIGATAVLGDGTLARAGGRVVKNVTGYDLTRMYSGSYGTLCALTELSLKLAPRPRTKLTLRADMLGLETAYAVTRELLRARLPLDAIALVTGLAALAIGPRDLSLYVRLAGDEATVARLRADVARRLDVVEGADDVWPRIAALPAEATTSVRGTWPAARPVEAYAVSTVWYPGIETLHILDDQEGAELLRQVREVAESQSGALVLERAPTALRRQLGTWGTPRVPPVIAARLRERFDPNGVLAPGRLP